MMRQRYSPPFTLALLYLLAAPLSAELLNTTQADGNVREEQISLVSGMTIQQVINHALQRDPNNTLPVAYQSEAQAQQRYAGSIIAGNPALSLHYQSDRPRTDQGLREFDGSLEFPLWHFGQRSSSREVAEWAKQAADSSLEVQRLMVAGAVREALWELAMAEERRALAEQSWQTAQRLASDVEKRVKAGDLARSDLLLAQDEALAKQDEYLLAAAEWQHAQKRYAMLTGLTVRPSEFVELRARQEAIDEHHPLLAELHARMQRAQAELRRAEGASSDNSQLIIGTRRTRDSYGADYVDSIGVGVRIPLGSSSHNGPKIAAASVNYAEQQSRYLSTERELQIALHEAHHTLETLSAQLPLAEEQQRLAAENLRMAQLAFKLGEIELAQLLRIQTRAFGAERNLAMRKLEAGLATARYNQAVGVDP